MGGYPVNTRRPVSAAGAVALLLLAACSTTTPPAPPTPTTSSSPTLHVKTLGQTAGWGDTSTQNTFTVTAVDRDPACWAAGVKPPVGLHTLLLHLQITTGGNPDTVKKLRDGLEPKQWQEVDHDGVTRRVEPGVCVAWDNRLPPILDINRRYTGTIELVVQELSGMLRLGYPGDTAGGWEWRY